jgi:hypothetical protein
MKTETKDGQKQAIRDLLLLGLTLDPKDAIKLVGCTKLSTRIGELEREGKLPMVYRQRKMVRTRFGKTSVMTYSIVKPKVSTKSW